MTTYVANAAHDSWLTPRDTFLLHALTGPPPAEVHRDLANILRAAAAVAHPWQPVPAPPDADPPAGVDIGTGRRHHRVGRLRLRYGWRG
jgi:hypothetical protein